MAHCFSVEYCCGVYQDLMEISKLCYFYRLSEGLLYIHLAFYMRWCLGYSGWKEKEQDFFVDLFFVDVNTKHTYDS